MEFGYDKFQINVLLSNKKVYNVPRFQREYSWARYELKTFYKDILDQITYDEQSSTFVPNDYFLGNILLVGDLKGSENIVDIIDGQQRLTTITIMLSIFKKKFIENNERALANKIWEFVMGKDINDDVFAILKNDTPNPYFQYLIQGEGEETAPKSEEEDRIKSAYNYFDSQLKKRNLKKIFKQKKDIDIDYVTMLKCVRDQLIRCYIIAIWTSEQEYANILFETLNAKGKALAAIDLIKNNILEKLNNVQPTDFAVNKWKETISNLNSKGKRISLSVFFRHFWISKYQKVTESKLYDSFLRKGPTNNSKRKEFLNELVENSRLYSQILVPILTDYDSRVEKQYLVQNLKNLSEYLNIVQSRVILLALMYQYNKYNITNRQLKHVLNYIENFHFVYNNLCSNLPSRLEGIYSSYAITIREISEKTKIQTILDELTKVLDEIYPSFEEFSENFVKLRYSKNKLSTNILAKYVINKLENSYADKDHNHTDGSIEHIINEDDENQKTTFIGNLVLLEKSINERIPSGIGVIEKYEYYNLSLYKHNNKLIVNYPSGFIEEKIDERGRKLAEYYWKNIIGKQIDG